MALLVPLLLGALAMAFWRRSFLLGLTVVNVMALSKIVRTFVFLSRDGALHHLVPALFGLIVCNAP